MMIRSAIDEQGLNKLDTDGMVIEKVIIKTKELEGAGEIIPTFELMKSFESEFPDFDFYFVGGSDLFPTLHLWQNGEKLKKEIKFLIFKREGTPELRPEDYPSQYVTMES